MKFQRGAEAIGYDQAAEALVQAMPRFSRGSDWDPRTGPGPLFARFADHLANIARSGEDEALMRHCLGLVERLAAEGSPQVRERLVRKRVIGRLAADQDVFALCRIYMGPKTLQLAQTLE